MARYDLGLSDTEFGRLCPATFDALLMRRYEEHKRACYYAGLVAASVYNANPYRDRAAKAVSPVDFMPGERVAKPQTLKDVVAAMTRAFGCGPGRVKRDARKT